MRSEDDLQEFGPSTVWVLGTGLSHCARASWGHEQPVQVPKIRELNSLSVIISCSIWVPRTASILKDWAISPAPLFPIVKVNGQKGHFRKSDSWGRGGGGCLPSPWTTGPKVPERQTRETFLLDKMMQLRGLLSVRFPGGHRDTQSTRRHNIPGPLPAPLLCMSG